MGGGCRRPEARPSGGELFSDDKREYTGTVLREHQQGYAFVRIPAIESELASRWGKPTVFVPPGLWRAKKTEGMKVQDQVRIRIRRDGDRGPAVSWMNPLERDADAPRRSSSDAGQQRRSSTGAEAPRCDSAAPPPQPPRPAFPVPPQQESVRLAEQRRQNEEGKSRPHEDAQREPAPPSPPPHPSPPSPPAPAEDWPLPGQPRPMHERPAAAGRGRGSAAQRSGSVGPRPGAGGRGGRLQRSRTEEPYGQRLVQLREATALPGPDAERWLDKGGGDPERAAQLYFHSEESVKAVATAPAAPRGGDAWEHPRRSGSRGPRPSRGEQVLYVCRHGARLDEANPEWAVAEGVERPYDTPLSDEGFAQARNLAQILAAMPQGKRPTAVVSSPFLRCMQTAEHIAHELGVKELLLHNALAEVFDPRVLKWERPPTGLEGSAPAERARLDLPVAHLEDTPLPDFPEGREAAARRHSGALDSVGDALLRRDNTHVAVLVTHGDAVAACVHSRAPGVVVYAVDLCGRGEFSRLTRGTAGASQWTLHTESGTTGVHWTASEE